MQKFTRALTREIEIEGERLAVTFDAKGISIRPIGSRRPPREMDWPHLLRAITGLHDSREALAALKSNPTNNQPGEPTIDAAPADLLSLLARLERWLAKHREHFHQALLPGATSEQLDSLQLALGQPLPRELRQWLSWRNGQRDDLIGAFCETFNLMSAEQIAAAWQDRLSRNEPDWDSRWIPFLDDYQDDLLVLDPTQPQVAVREVWRGHTEHPVVAASLTVWLERFVNDVEADRYHEDPERGEFHRLSRSP